MVYQERQVWLDSLDSLVHQVSKARSALQGCQDYQEWMACPDCLDHWDLSALKVTLEHQESPAFQV